MNKQLLGLAGERFASNYLISKGFNIVKTDYRSKCGQIDIIARNERGIHFIEVKTRSSDRFGRPVEAVTERKLLHIKNAASVFIKAFKVEEPVFFDVIEIMVNHIEGV